MLLNLSCASKPSLEPDAKYPARPALALSIDFEAGASMNKSSYESSRQFKSCALIYAHDNTQRTKSYC